MRNLHLVDRLTTWLRRLWFTQRKIVLLLSVLCLFVVGLAVALSNLMISKPDPVGDFALDTIPAIILEDIQSFDTINNRYVGGYALHDAVKEVTKEGTSYYYNVPLILVETPVDEIVSVQEKYEWYKADEMHHNDRFIAKEETMFDVVFELFVDKNEKITLIKH